MALTLKYDTPDLIKTISIERVVSPIATHLYYLILSCESGDRAECFRGLEWAAEGVADATKNMAAVASRLLEGVGDEDEIMRREMEPAISSLTASGQHVWLAAQKLSIQPHRAEHKEELVTSTQNVLLGTVKVLLVADDAVMRKIIRAADSLLSCLCQLETATNIPSLLKAFQGFSAALVLLNTLAWSRAEDLQDTRQRHHAACMLETLKKCVSMLYTAMHTTIKHPSSKEAQTAKKYILDTSASIVACLMSTLKGTSDGRSSSKNKSYALKIQELYKLLAISRSTLLRDSNCDSLLCDLVVYCMEVAESSRNKLKKMMVNLCRDVLQIWLEISHTLQSLENNSKNKQQLQSIMEVKYTSLKERLQRLDHTLGAAISYQILDRFVGTKFPFDELINALNQSLNDHSKSKMDILQPLITTFDCNADKMIQVSRFASGLSMDTKVVENVMISIDCIARLKDMIRSLLIKAGEKPGCPESLEVLQDLHHRWAEETNLLIGALSDLFDVKDFTSLIIQEMESKHWDCQKAFAVQCLSHFKEHAINLVDCMNLVIESIKRHIKKNGEPIYRNGLLVLVKQVELTVTEVTASIKHSLENGLDVESFEIFSEKILVAGKQFQHLSQGLNGLQHPHLLSPLREEVRQPPVLSSSLPAHDFEDPDPKIPIPVATGVENKNLTFQTLKKDLDKPSVVLDINSDTQRSPTTNCYMKPTQVAHDINLIPPLQKIVNAAKNKDVTAANVASIDVMELSNCYVKAAKMAGLLIDAVDRQKIENLKDEIVAMTVKVVRTAQEAAMGSSVSADNICRASTIFSDMIDSMRQILIPTTGRWYHAIFRVFQGQSNKTVVDKTKVVREVMLACADVVELVASSDLPVHGKHQECVVVLHNKLKTAQINAKHLTDLASLLPEPCTLQGPCFLWALSIQVVLNSLDKILGATAEGGKGCLTLQKKLALWSENSLRIQEASRLSSLNCKNKHTVKKMRDLQQEVRSLTEAYLQAADNLNSAASTDIHQLARTEFLQRRLQVKLTALSSLVSTINKEYSSAIQSIVQLAVLATAVKGRDETLQTALVDFEKYAELLLENVKAAWQKVQDSLLYIRNPSVRVSLSFTNDHLSSQMSEIVSRARQIAESQDTSELASLQVQMQCWAAKAHFLTAEMDRVEDIHPATKQQIRLHLQGKQPQDRAIATSVVQTEESRSVEQPWQISSAVNVNITEQTSLLVSEELSKRVCGCECQPVRGAEVLTDSKVDPYLALTSLCVKRETDMLDAQNNHVLQVTKDMEEKIYHMVQYLKRNGPIQSKEAFIRAAKDMVSSCESVTHFVRVIADHCLDKSCREELLHIMEQIVTITNQLSIITSVNAAMTNCKSSNEILVKNAQNLFHTILRGIRAAETACIKGLRQPDPDSDSAKATVLCLQWRRNLLIHRARQNSSLEKDDLGLRKTSQYMPGPSLAAPVHMKEVFK